MERVTPAEHPVAAIRPAPSVTLIEQSSGLAGQKRSWSEILAAPWLEAPAIAGRQWS
jgi:hypothetical protein